VLAARGRTSPRSICDSGLRDRLPPRPTVLAYGDVIDFANYGWGVIAPAFAKHSAALEMLRNSAACHRCRRCHCGLRGGLTSSGRPSSSAPTRRTRFFHHRVLGPILAVYVFTTPTSSGPYG